MTIMKVRKRATAAIKRALPRCWEWAAAIAPIWRIKWGACGGSAVKCGDLSATKRSFRGYWRTACGSTVAAAVALSRDAEAQQIPKRTCFRHHHPRVVSPPAAPSSCPSALCLPESPLHHRRAVVEAASASSLMTPMGRTQRQTRALRRCTPLLMRCSQKMMMTMVAPLKALFQTQIALIAKTMA